MLFEYIQLLSRKLVDFIYGIGYFGEQIAFFLTLFLIYPSYPKLYSYVFVIISLLNKAVNEYLKAEIQEPRPVDSQKFLASETFKRFSYGMPSGHTQGVGFALVYSYLLTHAHIVEFAVFALFVIYERYVFKNHTLPQLLIGFLLGGITAYIAYSAVTTFFQHFSRESSPINASTVTIPLFSL